MKAFPKKRSLAFGLLQLLVAMGMIAVLAVLSISLAGEVRAKSHDAGCVLRLRQIGGAVALYASDHGGLLPVVRYHPAVKLESPNYRTWATQIFPYLTGESLTTSDRALNQRRMEAGAFYFRCPADRAFRADVDHGWSYGWNRAVGTTINGGTGTNYSQAKLINFPRPAEVCMVADAYHDDRGLNFGSAVSDTSSDAPLTSDLGTHLRHPYPKRMMNAGEILGSAPRRNVLYLDGSVGKAHLTTEEVWRPRLEARGLFQ